jgi:hypothetical protein
MEPIPAPVVSRFAMLEGRHPLDLATARERLSQAEARVDLMRSILGATRRSTVAHEMSLQWLKELERSRYCRLLELAALIDERRRDHPGSGGRRRLNGA